VLVRIQEAEGLGVSRKLIAVPHRETWGSRKVQDCTQCFCLKGQKPFSPWRKGKVRA